MPVRKLPTFKGYTVDERLREFRKVGADVPWGIEFIPFSSKRGRKLIEELKVKGFTTPPMWLEDGKFVPVDSETDRKKRREAGWEEV
jgi:hypothetical protein